VRAGTGTSVDLNHAEFDGVRRLLEDKQTWRLLGRGTVDELANQIASCLPPRTGRSADDSRGDALVIARGLLEFAVADLEPKLFQQVLLARLQRMETAQASALDDALLAAHADVVARLEIQGELDSERFTTLLSYLKRVLDRLPPEPAGHSEIAVYLKALIDWTSTDPWPHRFDQPPISPTAIERKLRVSLAGELRDRDADSLARDSKRLVILGGPGSGKTWLARRTARTCAEKALAALRREHLDEVELPLYTTASRLFTASGAIREAVVSSALEQLGDLGGARINASLFAFFTNRNEPTLLVVDSLDEAQGSDERIRQADTLPWRIVLTSRPISWNDQLAMGDDDKSKHVGALQPLRYPQDVEPFIGRWFDGLPVRAADLIAQLRDRPALQQAATVPLILAFYCIAGGDGPLPSRRADLYAKVIRRMLTGLWRDSGYGEPDRDACLEILRDWAWSAADSDPAAGVGAWVDEFSTGRVRQSRDDRHALDHVAVPLGRPDDEDKTARRFVHRSLQEHLVAEHVGLGMRADDAANELLNHLWYDPDWQYAAPAALAMHPDREQILKALISSAAREDHLSAGIAAIDGCWEIRRFLARVAQESSESDWPPEVAEMIARARLELVTSPESNFPQFLATGWPTSNSQIIEWLLGRLAQKTYRSAAPRFAAMIARLDPSAEQRMGALQALLGLLADETSAWTAQELADAVIGIAVTADERAEVRQALLRLMVTKTDSLAKGLATEVTRVGVTAEERVHVRQALLRLIETHTNSEMAWDLIDTVGPLQPTEEERARMREVLLRLLAVEARPWEAQRLASTVAQLRPTAEERARVREALLRLLDAQTRPWEAAGLAEAVARLDPTAEDRNRARLALLRLLASRTDPGTARTLATTAVKLTVTAEERGRVRATLLRLVAGVHADSGMAPGLMDAVARLHPSAEDRAEARQALVRMLSVEIDTETGRELSDALALLKLTVADLVGSDRWSFQPNRALLTEARRNTELTAWIDALPLLATATEVTRSRVKRRGRRSPSTL